MGAMTLLVVGAQYLPIQSCDAGAETGEGTREEARRATVGVISPE
jgi:hypothetical protein